MNSVIVIGNNYSSVLELIRSLGTAGYEVRLLALSQVVDYIAAKSKYGVGRGRAGRTGGAERG